jgi:phosphoglycerol transferase MdoB-like AlkP superfamily enzyme
MRTSRISEDKVEKIVSDNAISFTGRLYQEFLDRWVFAAIWLPVAALGVYAKKQILTDGGGKQWNMLAHAFHRASTAPASSHFTFSERVSLYSSDCLVGFALVPLILVLVLVILPRRSWAVIVAVVSILTSFTLYLQMLSFKNIGHFIPWYLISAGGHWAFHHPQFVIEYVHVSGFLKMVVLAGIIIVMSAYMRGSGRIFQMKPRSASMLAVAVTGFALAGLLFGIWGTTRALAQSWYGRAEIPLILSATFLGNEDVGSGAAVKSPEALRAEYQLLADSKTGAPDPRYSAKAGGYDVIVLILETAPARYDSFESLEDLPTLKQLAIHSWIGDSHYTTFPYTAKATFSILTSMYPPNPLFFGGEPRQTPGLVRGLSSSGYATRYYVPHAFENHFEDDMYASIGFDKIFVSEPSRVAIPVGRQYYEDKIRCDLDALHALIHDVHEFSQQNRRYLAVFSPQIGHAPWPQLDQDDREMPLGERARALLKLQDAWLAQIVEQLTRDGRLDHTLIVVTGDHGIRTATEDPNYDPHGLLPDYSFHVPLLIFAPQILEKTEPIDDVTSHIDLAPTVLDLVGVKHGREFEEGLPVWDPGRKQRKVFLWAGDYLGAEGFAQNGNFTVWNKVADYVFTGHSLDEDVLRMADVGSAEQSSADELLKSMAKLDGDWWVSAMPSSKKPVK